MQTYFFFGHYTREALVDARMDRTEKAVGIIEDLEGHILSIYALLGDADLCIIANLPGNTEAMKASIALTRETGVRFTTRPAVNVDRFDELLSSDLIESFPEFQFPPEPRGGNDLN